MTQFQTLSIRTMTLNVVRLNHPLKRCRIGKLIKKKFVDIICLQETQLRTKEEKYLSQVFHGNLYHSPPLSKIKGVLVGFSELIPRTSKEDILF